MRGISGHKRPRTWLRPLLWGCFVGLTLGLVTGWVIWPPRFKNAGVALLPPDQKTLYWELVGLTFAQDQDLNKAHMRLYALQEDDIAAQAESQALQHIRKDADSPEAWGLAKLAQAMGVDSPPIVDFLQSQQGPPPDTIGGGP